MRRSSLCESVIEFEEPNQPVHRSCSVLRFGAVVEPAKWRRHPAGQGPVK